MANYKIRGILINLDDLFSPIGSQPDCSLLSEEEEIESTQIEYSAPEGAILINQDPEGEISTMPVMKWSYTIKGPKIKVDGPLCGVLYKENHGSIVPW